VTAVEEIDAVVVGGGQAGLATSHALSRAGVGHVVLERGRIGETWRGRWDSFCLVTPNWSVQLPGHPYDRDDPDGFMPRDEIVGYLERYAAAVAAPVREGVAVTSLARAGDGFRLETGDGPIEARSVVVASGAYQRPHRPAGAATLPAGLHAIDVEGYANERALPPGRMLVVGSGQSGCQVADELARAGRDVVLACGRAPWSPRRIGDRDTIWWSRETGFLDATVESLPAPSDRLFANLLITGRDGGRDLNLRTLRAAGVTLAGHFLGAEGGRVHLAGDLGESLAWGDERYRRYAGLIEATARERGLPAPELPEPEPFDPAGPESVELAGLGAVIFAGGFRPNYGAWVDVPGAFDELGFPRHEDGRSTVAPGLHFVGVHFLRKRKSSIFLGVGEDAALVAESVAARG
jgi:putative flavoprotein involved in K+ transport